MAASTVNIADFRRRERKGHSISRTPRSPLAHGLTVVETVSAAPDRQAELMSEALVSEDPAVFDIGKAREAQRMRHRLVFRPIVIPRHRSNVIRFGEPGVRVMRLKDKNPHRHWTPPSHDYDLPPAA